MKPLDSYDAVVLANGLFPVRPSVLDLLYRARVLICCDGAAQNLAGTNLTPDYIVGDSDSLTDDVRSIWSDRIISDPDQNTNDLTKAIHFCIEKGHRSVLIVGATGLREDHTLGNISLLQYYQSILDSVAMVSDFGLFTPITSTTRFNSVAGQQVSIFSLTPSCRLTFRGLRYPFENNCLNAWWQGTLNEALEGEFFIELHNPGQIIVYQLWPES